MRCRRDRLGIEEYWPFRKLLDLRDVHVTVKVFQNVQDSLQKLSDLTVLSSDSEAPTQP